MAQMLMLQKGQPWFLAMILNWVAHQTYSYLSILNLALRVCYLGI